LHDTGNMYERLGGPTGVAGVVESLYQRVLADPLINKVFEGVDMEAQRRHQAAFLAYAMGGPEFTGRTLERAHAGLNLEQKHYDAFVGHLRASLQEAGLSEEDIRTMEGRVRSVKDAVLHH